MNHKNYIFVFGSNLAGRHGKGAALWARQNKGAIYGRGIGLQGESYGIPTKDRFIKTLPLAVIEKHVKDFIEFARTNPNLIFRLTAIGTGLANYKAEQIAPMFYGVPDNVLIPANWKSFFPNHPSWEREQTEKYDKPLPLFEMLHSSNGKTTVS